MELGQDMNTIILNVKLCLSVTTVMCSKQHVSNTEAELKKGLLIKKSVYLMST